MTRLRVEAANWPDLERLLDAVLDLAPEAREAWLESLGSEHDGLRAALRAMLSHATAVQANNFLGTLPAVHLRTTPASRAGELVGPWRLLRELGTGGMASVWLAERADGMLQRPVALKLPHNIAHWRGLAERMARERDILASLTHPGIARLYDAGVTADNIPWLAIEYVEGKPIDQPGDRPLRERLRLFLQVGEAVAYAHGKLIVHRDLKPANILVTPAGQVRLLDFGIATLLEGDAAPESPLTELTGRALTVDYAAPEQIAGDEYTTSADVYSLGVVLFELVTGRRPHSRGSESRQTFENAVLKTPAPRASDVAPLAMRRELRGDLDAILRKALEKDPADRYPTVNAFVEDVARHLDGRPVLAQPESARYRAWKFVTRHRIGVASAAAIVIAILAGSVLALWQSRVAIAERDRAEETKRFIASIFQDTNPYLRTGGNLSAVELLRRARTRIGSKFAGRPGMRAELLATVGGSLNGLGAQDDAAQALRESVEIASAHHGPASVEAVHARALLADVFNRQRDTGRLKAELDVALPLARRIAALDAEPLVKLLMYSADHAIELRAIEDSRVHAREAFEVSSGALGAEDRLTVQASNLLAETYTFAPYDFPKMVSESERAMRLARAAFPAGSHDPLLTYAQMLQARVGAINGRFREAIAAHSDALASMRAELGGDNVDVANSLAELAGAERSAGEIGRSLEHFREALALYEKLNLTESADYKTSLVAAANALVSARRPRDAYALLRRARDIGQKLMGPLHWETLGATFNSARALAYDGRCGDARDLLALENAPGVQIAFPLWFAGTKGQVLRLCGEPTLAVAEFQRMLTMIPESPRADWDRMNVQAELGLSEAARGNVTGAYEALSRVRAIGEQLQVSMHPQYGEALTALAKIELERGNPRAAESMLVRVDEFWRGFDPDHPLARAATENLQELRGKTAGS
jgi:eukaryotic-like serine/threonine-protein kinase